MQDSIKTTFLPGPAGSTIQPSVKQFLVTITAPNETVLLCPEADMVPEIPVGIFWHQHYSVPSVKFICPIYIGIHLTKYMILDGIQQRQNNI